MRVDDLKRLFDYNYWATEQILSTANLVDQSRLAQPEPISFESVLGTLTHMLNVECLWRSRCQERMSPKKVKYQDDFINLNDLTQAWQEEKRHMLAYLHNLNDAQLDETIRYTGQSGNEFQNILWHILVQFVNHGTQHRSEVAMKLTGWGHSPGNLDFIIYVSRTK
ncbi:MAG: DinB family protein [Chloroflexota bacterium]